MLVNSAFLFQKFSIYRYTFYCVSTLLFDGLKLCTSCVGSKLFEDLYIDSVNVVENEADGARGSHDVRTARHASVDSDTTDEELAKAFATIRGMISDDIINSTKAVYIFDLKGTVCKHAFCAFLFFLQ